VLIGIGAPSVVADGVAGIERFAEARGLQVLQVLGCGGRQGRREVGVTLRDEAAELVDVVLPRLSAVEDAHSDVVLGVLLRETVEV
jgi:hypothetical protein